MILNAFDRSELFSMDWVYILIKNIFWFEITDFLVYKRIKFRILFLAFGFKIKGKVKK